MELTKYFLDVANDCLDNITAEENFSMFIITAKYLGLPSITKEIVDTIQENIEALKCTLNLEMTINDTTLQLHDTESFFAELETYKLIFQPIDETIIKVEVVKNLKDNKFLVFDMEKFSEFLNKLSLSEIINNFYELKKKSIFSIEVINANELYSASSMFCFKSRDISNDRVLKGNKCVLEERKAVCNFFNEDEFQFIPEDFDFSSEFNSTFSFLAKKLVIAYSLISLFNYSVIKNNKIELTLNGYKTHAFMLDFNDMRYENLIVYYDIYKWVYNDKNIGEKIELARNIISLYLNNKETLVIDDSIIQAIKSNYNIYLKDNIEKYFEIKSHAVEEILKMTDEIRETASNITDNIINNLKVVGTFIITVTIMNSLSDKKLDNIFTKDISLLSFGLVILSVIYLIYSIRDTYDKRKNIIIKYYRLKFSYNDILVKKDIETIFKKDMLIRKDIKKLDKRIERYKNLWIVLILVFLFIVIIGSNL